jgi:signal peptidase I
MNVKKVTEILSIIGGALLLLVLLITVLTYFRIPIGLNFFTVQTGSMTPYIGKGSLIITKDVADYRIGDVVTFDSVQSGETVPITHRIIDIQEIDNNKFYQTQGDANTAPDVDLIQKDDIIGKVYVRIPLIGYIFSFTRTPVGFLLLIFLPAGVIIYDEIGTIITEASKLRNKKKDTGKKKSVKKTFTTKQKTTATAIHKPSITTTDRTTAQPSPQKVTNELDQIRSRLSLHTPAEHPKSSETHHSPQQPSKSLPEQFTSHTDPSSQPPQRPPSISPHPQPSPAPDTMDITPDKSTVTVSPQPPKNDKPRSDPQKPQPKRREKSLPWWPF